MCVGEGVLPVGNLDAGGQRKETCGQQPGMESRDLRIRFLIRIKVNEFSHR